MRLAHEASGPKDWILQPSRSRLSSERNQGFRDSAFRFLRPLSGVMVNLRNLKGIARIIRDAGLSTMMSTGWCIFQVI